MQFTNSKEALQRWLKYLQYIFPSIIMLIALVGCILVVFVEGADTVGWIIIGAGVLLGVVLFAIYTLLTRKLDKLIFQQK